MRALLIDHDDSFTFNLRHWLNTFLTEIKIVNHLELESENIFAYDLLVLSPGPRSPQDYPHVIRWLNSVAEKKPVFGVCLGMQLMASASGGKVISYNPPLHGKTSKLNCNIPEFQDLSVARYHSLYCTELTDFDVIAESENIPMWIEHKKKKWLGVQFHPESFLTEDNYLLQLYLQKWLLS